MVSSVLSYESLSYTSYTLGDYSYPQWANVTGWLIAASSMCAVPVIAVHQLVSQPGSTKQVRESIYNNRIVKMATGRGRTWMDGRLRGRHRRQAASCGQNRRLGRRRERGLRGRGYKQAGQTDGRADGQAGGHVRFWLVILILILKINDGRTRGPLILSDTRKCRHIYNTEKYEKRKKKQKMT